jgi:exodeoxyribonuclease V alpha subunit
MLQRNLLYTAVTRGKRLVVIVGQKKALAIAVKGAGAKRRWSKLAEWLNDSGRWRQMPGPLLGRCAVGI